MYIENKLIGKADNVLLNLEDSWIERRIILGVAESLTIILIVLKLVGVISWSWWLVLIPELFAMLIYIVVWIVWLFYSVKLHKQERK